MFPTINPEERDAVDNPSDAFLIGALVGSTLVVCVQALYAVVRNEVEGIARGRAKHRERR